MHGRESALLLARSENRASEYERGPEAIPPSTCAAQHECVAAFPLERKPSAQGRESTLTLARSRNRAAESERGQQVATFE